MILLCDGDYTVRDEKREWVVDDFCLLSFVPCFIRKHNAQYDFLAGALARIYHRNHLDSTFRRSANIIS